jgi:glycosyltransferase involved in cell wall biosynthesis
VSRAPRLLVSGLVLDQPMGGVRRHNQELLPRLARLLRADGGHLALLVGKPGLAFDPGPDIELLTCDVPPRPIPMRALRESKALRREVERGAFDLVHTGHLPAPRALPVPFSLTLHDLRALEGEHTPFSRRLIARQVVGDGLQRAARVFTVSEFTAAGLVKLVDSVRGKLTLIPNAADHFEPAPRAPQPGARLLHLGHLEPRKNLSLLIRALAEDRNLPALQLAGSGKGDEPAKLRALAAQLEVDVLFSGPFDESELPKLLAGCAALILPSKLEGFGIPALEAQRAGVPLAVSRAGALLEVVGPDVPSFDPDDAPGCARAIRTALESGARTAPTQGSWDASAEVWYDALTGR